MKWYEMIEIYFKYDNMHTFGIINAFICINNHVNSCINSMLLEGLVIMLPTDHLIILPMIRTNTTVRRSQYSSFSLPIDEEQRRDKKMFMKIGHDYL